MSLAIVDCNRIAPQPWRNGGGHTRELLVWPPGTGAGGADDWSLRISVADIEADGPFSPYPDVDRWFAVVEGAGVVLRIDGERHVLEPDSAPLAFRGELAPACDLIDGATRDLNLMVRRGRGQAQLRRAVVDEEHVSPAPIRALFVADAVRLQIDDADAARLKPFTLVFSDHATHQRWRIEADDLQARAWWIDFRPGQAA